VLKSSTNDFVVLGCSALKKSYRDTLQKNCPDLQVVFLHTTVEILKNRVSNRKGHFFPASLLKQQLDDLECPNDAIYIDSSQTEYKVVELILEELRLV